MITHILIVHWSLLIRRNKVAQNAFAQLNRQVSNYNQFRSSKRCHSEGGSTTNMFELVYSAQMYFQQQQRKQVHQQQQQQQQPNEVRRSLIAQDACTSSTRNFQMQSINSFQHLSSQYIDQLVEIEMKRLKANCSQEEANYVEQMLLENPIIVERRKTTPFTPQRTNQVPPASSPSTKANHTVAPDYCYPSDGGGVCGGHDGEAFLQEIRKQTEQNSDSCRRSRLNNKIKRAKTKYRHKFMSNKLLQSANVLECLEKLIEQTEHQLINQGFNALQLVKLKENFFKNFVFNQ